MGFYASKTQTLQDGQYLVVLAFHVPFMEDTSSTTTIELTLRTPMGMTSMLTMNSVR